MPDKIRALFIFEIMGKPPEHIVETLEKLIDQLSKNKGLEIKNKTIHKPKEIERQDESGGRKEGKDQIQQPEKTSFFTTFAEVEVETEEIRLILAITLNMLPAHVEILKPENFHLKNTELSSLLTELTVKIHKYDEIAKSILIERNTILNKLKDSEERCKELEKEIMDKTEKDK